MRLETGDRQSVCRYLRISAEPPACREKLFLLNSWSWEILIFGQLLCMDSVVLMLLSSHEKQSLQYLHMSVLTQH